ncbi:transcription factor BIM1 isoform X2 [Alnus glutinosa]|uniref:transcription factor BIM1 isoform X2 n=1 Tax=Alnus glutinosa TaxID=3517 RepID=UPI002D79CC03|nr:transcription factor BIM1 isoform X2 [Alnus glutinosa]
MELPQPRPFGTEGRKPTHDFLSLYSHPTAQQDPLPASQEGRPKLGQWTPSERPSQSSTSNSNSNNNNNNNHRNSFSSLSSSQATGQKNKSFMEMIQSAKVGNAEEDDLDDEEEFVLKKEPSTTVTTAHRGELRVKVDGKSSDQKANTPRSKHSATEQRRRSKINDRFQMLRELIPHSEQKRDKASFLLEVIEYIQFLQEKVQKYEGSYQGWNHEPEKLMPWRNNHRPTESYVDQSRVINSGSAPALVFAEKFDEKNICVSPTIAGSAQHPVESDVSTVTTFKQMDHHPGITKKAMPFPMPLQSNFFTPVRTSAAVPELPPKLVSDGKDIPSQPQPQLCQMRACTTDGTATSDKLKEQELTVEGGTISISSVYSQGLLSTLTQALQSSGVDLSQASISVQIELGKRSNGRVSGSPSIVKDKHVPASNHGTTRSRLVSAEDSEKALKKLKTCKS